MSKPAKSPTAHLALLNSKFARFLFSGGIATAVNILSRMAFSLVMPYATAIILAYLTGMVVAFTLFKRVVFRTKRDSGLARELFGFVVINAWGLVQTLVVSNALVDYVFPWCGFAFRPHDTAHILAVSLLVITSYIGHKKLTFRGSGPKRNSIRR